MPTKVAILGTGNIAKRYFSLLRDRLGCKPSMYETIPSQAETIPSNQPYSIIATPPHTHVDLLMNRIAAGDQNILVEKPLFTKARTLESRLARPVFGVCNMRYHPGIQMLKAKLGMIGDPIHFTADYMFAPPRGWLDPLYDCAHDLDLAMWLLNQNHVEASLASRDENLCCLNLKCPSLGLTGYIRLMYFGMNYKRQISITGVNGTLTCDITGFEVYTTEVVFTSPTRRKTTLFHADSVPQNLMYERMLADFLLGKSELQNYEEAYCVANQLSRCDNA